jgi:hypothetical protein
MKNKITEAETHLKLTRGDTNNGVVALVTNLNLWGGSNGSISLYDLIGVYLLCPEARIKMNKIADEYRKEGDYKL